MERKLSVGIFIILACGLLFNPMQIYSQEKKIAVLKAGAPVLFEITETIDSEKANVGDIVKLRVIRPVKVDDIEVIKVGTRADGKVAEVKRAKGWGVKGEIAMTLTNTQAVDGTEVLLSATQRATGEGKTGTATAVGVGTGLICLPVALTGFLIRGEQGRLLSGYEVKGYVDGDYKIKVKDMGSEKKKTSIYSFEEIKEWHNRVKDREWRKISESEDTTHCYDTRNISYPSKGIVRVYTITYYESKKAINDKINQYRQLGLSTKGYENLYGTLTLQEINCNNKIYLPIYFMDYDKNRNPLNQSYDLSSNGWSEISSTMPTLEKLYKVVCPGGK